jgi:hypothetical protein
MENALNIWFQEHKDEENIPFPFLYVSMAMTEVASVSSIDMPARFLRSLEITECVYRKEINAQAPLISKMNMRRRSLLKTVIWVTLLL